MTRSLISLPSVIAIVALALALPTLGLAATPNAPASKATGKKAVIKKAAKPAPEAPLALADDDQKAAAGMAYLGDYACEFNQTVKVAANNLAPGYIDVSQGKQTWVMKPVLSSTGALRLEDVKGRMLMIQIANKSMVMDTKIGQRLVDGCQHEKQREFERAMGGASTEGSLLVKP
jgi:hypothetical protein